MNFVIPMAGEGKRFQKAGFLLPKYLIEAKGKTLLEWSVDSLPLELASTLIFVALKEHEEKFNIIKKITEIYVNKVPKIDFVLIDKVTRGQAETVYMSKELMNVNEGLVVFNIDTFFYSSSLKNNLLKRDNDGVIGCFNSHENRFSFASVNSAGFVNETAEKDVISTNALTGLYHFHKVSDFLDAVRFHLQNNILYKDEFYIAPMYNYLIQKGKRYILDHANEHHILGTPEELNSFINL